MSGRLRHHQVQHQPALQSGHRCRTGPTLPVPYLSFEQIFRRKMRAPGLLQLKNAEVAASRHGALVVTQDRWRTRSLAEQKGLGPDKLHLVPLGSRGADVLPLTHSLEDPKAHEISHYAIMSRCQGVFLPAIHWVGDLFHPERLPPQDGFETRSITWQAVFQSITWQNLPGYAGSHTALQPPPRNGGR